MRLVVATPVDKNDRLSPPLMHAFRAAHRDHDATVPVDIRDYGERVIASRRAAARTPISETELRRLVNIDLVALFNTTNLEAIEDLSTAPEVRKSIINFGFPDLTRRTIEENEVRAIAGEIESALRDFEPRLARKSIKARRDDTVTADTLRVRFLVSAELRAYPVNVQAEFVAEVEVELGQDQDRSALGMNREFLKFYNQELAILREQAAEFAQEYPGVAERLGGLLEDNIDPMIGGLLEGAAFLAARVQLKLKHEFSDFTTNLIDQLAPHYLAPTPSFVLVQASPKFGDPSLRDGRTIVRGANFDATYREAQRNVACRFTLASPITLWPFEVVKADYLTGAAAVQALIPGAGADCVACLRLQLTVRSAARPEDEPADKEARARPELRFSSCRIKALRFHLVGQETDAVALYEQLFAHCRGVYFRVLELVRRSCRHAGRSRHNQADRLRRE